MSMSARRSFTPLCVSPSIRPSLYITFPLSSPYITPPSFQAAFPSYSLSLLRNRRNFTTYILLLLASGTDIPYWCLRRCGDAEMRRVGGWRVGPRFLWMSVLFVCLCIMAVLEVMVDDGWNAGFYSSHDRAIYVAFRCCFVVFHLLRNETKLFSRPFSLAATLSFPSSSPFLWKNRITG